MAKPPKTGRNRRLGLGFLLVALLMVSASFAAVPFYRLFCQITGYAGTPRIASSAEASPGPAGGQQRITVRFNADVASGLRWRFQPRQESMVLQLGESGLAFFEAVNLTQQAITGMATFNVTPEKAAPYFTKTDCFCFISQTLNAGQKADMPVSFFIDPKLAADPLTSDVKTITLSYTFFKSKEASP
ncbi:Cytochrome c oxidase assembly protein CtaG [Rhodospirillaceae bacterium LM-1]|nr:Cytochrome c oxidase assembly protein CtaG [Rhodospirillaceae bacterium LM-1]